MNTLQILEKRFPPEDARAIAQAIEEEMSLNRLVTNDSLKLQLAELEVRLLTKLGTMGLTGAGIILTAVYFMVETLKR